MSGVCHIYNFFIFLPAEVDCFCGAAEIVGDVGNDIIGMFNHPSVPFEYCIPRMRGGDLFGINRMRKVKGLFAFCVGGSVGKDDVVADVCIFFAKLVQYVFCKRIKIPLISDIEHINVFFGYKPLNGLFKNIADVLRRVTVSEECAYMHLSHLKYI